MGSETRYGRLYYFDADRGTYLARRSSSEAGVRTFEWIQRMNEATSMADLEAALVNDAGEPYGLLALNLMATSNRHSNSRVGESFLYVLVGRVPRRAGDTDLDRNYQSVVLNSLDPGNEWTGGFYLRDELPTSRDFGEGYRANCNVSPIATDPNIGIEFPESITFDRRNRLSTYRQLSFERRAPGLTQHGGVSTDELLIFAGDTRDYHWDRMARVILETFAQNGDPLGLWQPGEELPAPYAVMAEVGALARGDGVRADPDSEIAAYMHMLTRRIQTRAAAEGDADAAYFASAGRPRPVEPLTGETARLVFQEVVDTFDYVMTTYPGEPPTMQDILQHCFADGRGHLRCDGTHGSGGSFRNLTVPLGPESPPPPNSTGWFDVIDGGHAHLQLSRLGAPGDVTVHLLKPYITADIHEPLGPIMSARLARGEFTTLDSDLSGIDVSSRTRLMLP